MEPLFLGVIATVCTLTYLERLFMIPRNQVCLKSLETTLPSPRKRDLGKRCVKPAGFIVVHDDEPHWTTH